MRLEELLPFLILALAGSLHCAAMCGGFSVFVARRPGGPGATLLPYLAGKTTTYAVLGVAVSAGLDAVDAGPGGASSWRSAVALAAGGLLILFGLAQARLVPSRLAAAGGWTRVLVRPVTALWNQLGALPGASGSLGLGLVNGLLPCGLSWAALLLATQVHPATALVGMAVFGLGTAPVLLVLGLGAQRLSLPAGLPWRRVAGVAVALLGLWTLWRGVPTGEGPHCPACAEPAAPQSR